MKVMASKLLRWRGHGGFQEHSVANGWIAALVFDRDGMQPQDVVDRKELWRGIHLASLRIKSPCCPKTSCT